MGGKHRHWHRRWTVDLATLTATHDSGLVVRGVAGDGYWDYEAVNLDAWQASTLTQMPIGNLVPHARRLMQEASRVLERARERAGRSGDDDA